MKATGIVRRLDDLGRLVIPKEIRKQYRMKEGDSIEFFIDNDRIVIQKFDVMSKHMEEIMIMCDTLRAIYQNTVFFVKDECMVKTDHKIHDHFLMIAQTHRLKDFDNERIYEDSAQRYKGLIYPVTAFGDWYGSFIIVFDKKELVRALCSRGICTTFISPTAAINDKLICRGEYMRLDKYLKTARILKRRTVSKELADQERVYVNGKIAKPSTDVKVGDTIKVIFGYRELTVNVTMIRSRQIKMMLP